MMPNIKKQKDLKTKQEEIEMEQPILVEQDIGVLLIIKKVFDLKVEELEDKLKATQDKVEFAERRIDCLKNKEDWDGECEECGNPCLPAENDCDMWLCFECLSVDNATKIDGGNLMLRSIIYGE
eukprot:SAG11_NODE_3989_length_2119_cov_90.913366_3_plen_124_part_00